MIVIRNAESELLIREACAKCSYRPDEFTGVYMVFEDFRPLGNCIYKLKEKDGMIIFADHNITESDEISDLTLRTVTDWMMRHGAKTLTSYAAFPEKVYRAVGFTVAEEVATVDLTNFSFSCCGQTKKAP